MLDRSVSVGRHLVALRATGAAAGKLDAVRAYRQAQFLRILLRDVLGLADLAALQMEHSAVAEACLIFLHKLIAPDGDLTIVALGKFGGCELSYGADLDVVFVGENTRAAQEIVAEMSRATPEGSIASVDARLRPDGEKGPLTCPLAAYAAYYEARAQPWELQALTRARAVCGPAGADFIAMAQRVWCAAGQRADLFAQIDSMRERIRRDRGTGSEILDFKTGLGGMIEAEFLVQALQMRAGVWNPGLSPALVELQRCDRISESDRDALQRGYEFLRRCESILRRWENKGVAALPPDETEHSRLARRFGSKDVDSFCESYRAARETIHAVYQRYVQ
jgi:glutamate-ammonia-ligase adenylyltransferase